MSKKQQQNVKFYELETFQKDRAIPYNRRFSVLFQKILEKYNCCLTSEKIGDC